MGAEVDGKDYCEATSTMPRQACGAGRWGEREFFFPFQADNTHNAPKCHIFFFN